MFNQSCSITYVDTLWTLGTAFDKLSHLSYVFLIQLWRVSYGRGDRSIGEDLEKVKQVRDFAIHTGGGEWVGEGRVSALRQEPRWRGRVVCGRGRSARKSMSSKTVQVRRRVSIISLNYSLRCRGSLFKNRPQNV